MSTSVTIYYILISGIKGTLFKPMVTTDEATKPVGQLRQVEGIATAGSAIAVGRFCLNLATVGRLLQAPHCCFLQPPAIPWPSATLPPIALN